jgi:hypothetical protein
MPGANGGRLRAAPPGTGGGLVVQVVFPALPGQLPPVRISPAVPSLRAG